MPVPCNLGAKRDEVSRLSLDRLEVRGPVYRRNGYLRIQAHCSACGTEREYNVDNLLAGKSRRCRCLRGLKYDNDPLAKIFGARFDALKQRCENSASPLYAKYGARGIRCEFESREAFIRHMMSLRAERYPSIRTANDLRRYDIARIENASGYRAGNLRLVSREMNAGKGQRSPFAGEGVGRCRVRARGPSNESKAA